MLPLRLLPHGVDLGPPTRATSGAAGYDLRAAVDAPVVLEPGGRALVPCGFALALPDGWEAQIRPRSGLALKAGVTVINSPGTVDPDYRGEVCVPLVNLGHTPFTVNRGDRVAQMVLARFEAPSFTLVDTLPPTARGTGGFGSTGR